MRKYIITIFTALIPINAAAQTPVDLRVIKYNLIFEFDKKSQKIMSRLDNNSSIDLNIRKDSTPSSLLALGVKFSAFEDNVELKRFPLFFSIGSNADIVSVPAHGSLNGSISLDIFMKGYCEVLAKNPILIFWSYSSQSGEYKLLPTDGAFRLTKNDVICNAN